MIRFNCRYLIFGIYIILISCGPTASHHTNNSTKDVVDVFVPVFNEDSAYQYITDQVTFGPRVPNTKAHLKTADYLGEKLKSFGADVIIQDAEVKSFDDKILKAKNIIGQYNVEKNDRILLFAHWDSRPFADQDEDESRRNEPIDGANDGGSGVGVLLEMARQLNEHPINIGIDIIFFDAEDYGLPEHLDLPYKPDTWCLGSQYWAQNPHKTNYYARYGILLDMVGAKGATFYKEHFSMQMAPNVIRKIWDTASRIGYSEYFIFANGGAVTDDHIYVNKYLGIPCVDIIQYDPGATSSFGSSWHTHNDNMDIIDKKTLKAVGQTLLDVLYREK